jgi:hypothetical protein
MALPRFLWSAIFLRRNFSSQEMSRLCQVLPRRIGHYIAVNILSVTLSKWLDVKTTAACRIAAQTDMN